VSRERDRRRALRRLEAGCAGGMARASSRRNYAWALGRDLGNFAAAGLVDDVAEWEARIAAAASTAGIAPAEALRQVRSGIKAGSAENWPGFTDTAEWADWKARRGAAPAEPRRAEAVLPPVPPPLSAAAALAKVRALTLRVLESVPPRPEAEPELEPEAEPEAEPEPPPAPMNAPAGEVPLWRWCWARFGVDLGAAEWWAVRAGFPFPGDPESYEALPALDELPEGALVAVQPIAAEGAAEVRRAALCEVHDGIAYLADLTEDGRWWLWTAPGHDVRTWCGIVLRPEDAPASVAALAALAVAVAA
jgi:hypothetical protein